MVTVTRHTGQGGSRYYLVEGDPSVEGIRLPSVTTATGVVDKPALVGWAERMGIEACVEFLKDSAPTSSDYTDASCIKLSETYLDSVREATKGATRRIKEDAADIGTETHAIIESILNSELGIVVPDHLKSTVDSFTNWYNQSGIVAIELTESMVYSAEYKYAGTIDVVATMSDGSTAIIDWKTSNGLYKETSLQLAAYGQAYAEQFGKTFTDLKLLAVRLGKNYPAFEVKEVTNHKECLDGFIACQGIRDWIVAMRETEWKK